MKRCFVISPIGVENTEIRKHADRLYKYLILPATKELNIEAIRADHLDKPGKITDQMFSEIFQSDICIAVLTGLNPNVFYEMAIAQSINKPLIMLIQKEQILPFDIRDLRCIYYDLEIDSYEERIYINKLISHVKSFEQENWKVDDFFKSYRHLLPQGSSSYKLIETPGDYKKESEWLKIFKNADKFFYSMGISLDSWRTTKGFEGVLYAKQKEGCDIRLLFVHEENSLLKNFIKADNDKDYYNKVCKEITYNFKYFSDLKKQYGNIQLRKIRDYIPHCFITQTDKEGVSVQCTAAPTLYFGPLWEYENGTSLYNVYLNQFEKIWNAAEEYS